MTRIQSFDHVGVTVADLDGAIARAARLGVRARSTGLAASDVDAALA